MSTGILLLLVTTLQVAWYASGVNVKSKLADNSKIVYPGPIKEVTANRYGGTDAEDVPDECKSKQYCTTKPAAYPQDRFNGLFKATAPVGQPSLLMTDINDRQGDPEEIDNCETTVEFEPLYKVRSKRGDWRTVIQAPEKNYVQLVRLETCREDNQACFTIFPSTPGYTTFCKQKYSTWEFVVDAQDGSGKTEKIPVDLPTCCSCHYKPT